MSIRIGTGSGAVEPTEFRIGSIARGASRVMVGIGNDAVPAYVREVPALQPMTVGSDTRTWVDETGEGKSRQIATFQVTGGGKARLRISLNGPYVASPAGSFIRLLSVMDGWGNTVASVSKNQGSSNWVVTDYLSDEFDVVENGIFYVYLSIYADLPSDRYLNSWSVELIPSEVEEPVDPEETVVITGTLWGESRTQFRDALTARGLDYRTVETLPFLLDTSQATSLQGLFEGCTSLTSVPEMDTSKVTNMRGMFSYCDSLPTVPAMDTSKVTDMSSMFSYCMSLTSVPEMDTSKVTNMNAMYAFNPSLTSVPEMDTSNVTNMSFMFAWCTALAYVPDMDTSNVTNMTSMLSGTQSLTDGNIRLFGQHPSVNTTGMIESSALTVEPFFVPAPPAVETQTVLSVVPSEITEGESITLTATVTPTDAVGSVTFTVAGQTSTVAVANGTATDTLTVDMVGEHEVSAEFIPADDLDFMPSSDIASITVTAGPVILTGSGTEPRDQFRAALTARGLDYTTVKTIPFDMDTSQATSLEVLFLFCFELTEVPELDTSNVTTMNNMFAGCRSLTEVPEMDTSKVGDMSYMFSGCSSLTSVPEMDTSNVTDMTGMFSECSSLTYVPDMETSTVAHMSFMFSGCTALTDGNVRLFGKHPDVSTTDMIFGSGLTKEPFVIPAVETSLALSVVPNEITEGEQVILTATVTPNEAVGEVTFTVGTQTSTVALAGGTASTTLTLDTPGEYEATASFVPTDEADFTASSDTFTVTVLEFVPDPVETQTTLVVVPEEIEEGELVTVTATVTPAEAAGVVEFDVAGQPSTVNVVNGVASTTATLDVAGEYGVTANFVPSNPGAYNPSSASSTVTVTAPAPATYNYAVSLLGGNTGTVWTQVASHTIDNYAGPVTISGRLVYQYGGTTGIRFTKNGVLVQEVRAGGNPRTLTTTTSVVTGDVIGMWGVHSIGGYTRYTSGDFSIVNPPA